MRLPWAPAPFIPDEQPWQDGRPWRAFFIGLAVLGGATALTFRAMLGLDGHGDQLRLYLEPEQAVVVSAVVVATAVRPPSVSYTFTFPTRTGRGYVKTTAVPADVAERLRPGAKLDVTCMRRDPQISAPRAQAAIGPRFANTAASIWVMCFAGLALIPLAIALLRAVSGLASSRPRRAAAR
ncbi:MAG: hypothetical protein JWM80_3846 [Cyanobacteria bacterium RYN_339]|nr:hypothetical protein [Cyanobacteria bacterium RYN_339]